jgi:hypothetical protein
MSLEGAKLFLGLGLVPAPALTCPKEQGRATLQVHAPPSLPTQQSAVAGRHFGYTPIHAAFLEARGGPEKGWGTP